MAESRPAVSPSKASTIGVASAATFASCDDDSSLPDCVVGQNSSARLERIAATAIAHDADLLTQDGDFDAVPSLRVIKL